MISRRHSLKLFAGMMVGSLMPMTGAVSAAPIVLWREEAARAAEPIVDAMVKHPFTQGLIDGTLPKDAFLFYQAENVRYLESYAKTLAHLAERLSTEADKERMRRWATDTVAAEGWARDTYREFRGREFDESIEITPAAQLYAGWEAQAAAFRPLAEAVAAILPCFWVYGEIGRYIAENVKKEGNPYAGWLAGYGDPAYAETVDLAMAIGDNLARELDADARRAMTEAFVKSVRMEWMMWDAAYKKESWPV